MKIIIKSLFIFKNLSIKMSSKKKFKEGYSSISMSTESFRQKRKNLSANELENDNYVCITV